MNFSVFRWARTSVGFLFLFLLSVTAARAQDRQYQLDSLFSNLHNQGRFNGNVLVAEGGKILFEKSFGLANETTQEGLTRNSSFELASVSKQFTAVGIVLLKEKGLLTYEDKLVKYFPELQKYHEITIRQLLQHASGIPDYMELFDEVWTDSTKIATNTNVIRLIAEYEPEALFEPGSKWKYSNTGYVLLASIIEKVSGVTYADFLGQNIFAPLKMTSSFVYNRRQNPRIIPNSTLGYVYSDSLKQDILPDSVPGLNNYVYCLDGIVGDGMVNSTATDLLKWDRALYTTGLLTQQGIQDIFSYGFLNNGNRINYGFGWYLNDLNPGGKTAAHSGSWPGFITYIERNTDQDKTIILLQNHDNDKTVIPVRQLRLILY